MIFRVDNWIGRLGNHIIQLSNAIHTAKRYRARLETPEHPTFGKLQLDFRQRPGATEQPECFESSFFWPHECFGAPILHDQVRRSVLQRYVLPIVSRKTTPLYRRLFRDSRVGPDTLVINIRSGRDIFLQDPKPQADYMQPPISFYRRIIDAGGYDDCLIVTEPDQMNPVIDALMKCRKGVRLNKHRSVYDDMHLVLAATHLVLAHSSFTWCLALMSQNLEVLHQPGTFRVLGVPDLKVTTWEITEFVEPGEWEASDQQMKMMVNHRDDQVFPCSESVDYLPRSAFGVTNDPVQLRQVEISRAEMEQRMRSFSRGRNWSVGDDGSSRG